jgi:hypothetical protein
MFFSFFYLFQKAMLLQQTSWQNNVRMSQLAEQVIIFLVSFQLWGLLVLASVSKLLNFLLQIHGPLSSIRALAKMLTTYVNRSQVRKWDQFSVQIKTDFYSLHANNTSFGTFVWLFRNKH